MAGLPAPMRHSGRQPPIWRHLDLLLPLVTLVICGFGSLMIYSATRDQLQANGISPDYYVRKQIIFVVIGLAVMALVATIDYRHYRQWAPVIYGGTLLALLAVFVVGHKSKGAQAWFQVGSYQLEPSEFAKIGLIVGLAGYCAMRKGRISFRSLVVVLILVAIPFALIYKQPDLGTALVLAAVVAAILLVAGLRGIHFALLALITVAGLVGVVHFGVLKGYQQARLTSFVSLPAEPNAKLLATVQGSSQYNQTESKVTIGDGGAFGKGLFKGSQTNLSFVPEQRTDFIFTAVGEQLGFFGSALLLLLFVIMLWRIWRAAALSKDLFGTLLCVGVIAMVVFQVFENVGMTLGIMPVAGIPLPFMSYGGSAVIATFAGVGLALNVSMRRYT